MKQNTCLAAACWTHVHHFGPTGAHFLNYDAGIFVIHVNGDVLDRLQAIAVLILTENHTWAGD